MATRPHLRRLLALFALAWLNLVVQPCLAQAPAVPAGMEHCDHMDGTWPPESCPAMQADDCIAVHDLNADAPRAAESQRGGALLGLLPPAPRPLPPHSPELAGDVGGPPLTIRYCSLRN